MGFRQFLLGTAVAVATAASGSAASAAIFTATYTGTVSSGYDQTGEFGTAGADLAGLEFTSTYRFDTSLGVDDVTGYYEQNSGGSAYGTATPMLDATLKIGAVTVHVPGGYQGYSLSYNDGNFGVIKNISKSFYSDSSSNGGRYVYNYIYTNAAPTTISNGFSSAPSGTFSGFSDGYYQNSFYNYDTGYIYSNYAHLVQDHVTISGAVPEPATWGLMLMGFGGLGAMLRRRRSRGVLATA